MHPFGFYLLGDFSHEVGRCQIGKAVGKPDGDVVVAVFANEILKEGALLCLHICADGFLPGACFFPGCFVFGEDVDMEIAWTGFTNDVDGLVQAVGHDGAFDSACAHIDGNVLAVGVDDEEGAFGPLFAIVQADEGFSIYLDGDGELSVLNGNELGIGGIFIDDEIQT